MNVLLIGSGGREHALAWKLRQSSRLTELFIAPGNPGTVDLGRNLPVKIGNVGEFVALAIREQADLVVVGPEAPLAAGLADALIRAGIACFGPAQAAATIEASKTFAKNLMLEAGIPTAAHHPCVSAEAALRFLETENWSDWRVVKADGLHAGKGVVVAQSENELRAAITMLAANGERLVLEEALEGPEISLLAFSDGQHVAIMPPAQDHKRLHEGDHGPNTGGMGAYAPVSLPADQIEELGRTVIEPVIATLAARGTPFVGVLYAGLMLTPSGPRVIEYNARWGDPEAQVLLPLLDTDLLDIMQQCVTGSLRPETVRWRADAALGIVLAAADYPAVPRGGDPITLPPLPPEPPQTHIFHAGTATRDGALVTAGGRVLTVVGVGETLELARTRAYAGADMIYFDGKQMRRDIGWRASAGSASA